MVGFSLSEISPDVAMLQPFTGRLHEFSKRELRWMSKAGSGELTVRFSIDEPGLLRVVLSAKDGEYQGLEWHIELEGVVEDLLIRTAGTEEEGGPLTAHAEELACLRKTAAKFRELADRMDTVEEDEGF